MVPFAELGAEGMKTQDAFCSEPKVRYRMPNPLLSPSERLDKQPNVSAFSVISL